jgi:hypothetical protein
MSYVVVDRPVPEVTVVTLNRPERMTYLHSEGIGQLYLRLLTDNFEEATRARKEGRPAVFRDDR